VSVANNASLSACLAAAIQFDLCHPGCAPTMRIGVPHL
jgi:hypothetical protein